MQSSCRTCVGLALGSGLFRVRVRDRDRIRGLQLGLGLGLGLEEGDDLVALVQESGEACASKG